MQYVKNLMEERESLATQVLAMADKAASEERSLTESENASIDSMRGRIESLDTELSRWADTTTSFRSFSDLSKKIDTVRDEKAQEPERREAVTPGIEFTKSDAYTGYAFRGSSSRCEVRGMVPEETRALHTNFDLGVSPAQQFFVENPPIATPILDAIGFVPVSTNSVEYVKWAFTNNADEIDEGDTKPESLFSRTLTPQTIATVAHWTEMSRQLAEDERAVANAINTDLRDGILAKIESKGASVIAAAVLPTATADALVKSIRVGLAKVPAGYSANAVLLHPEDWADLDITVMGGTLGGPNVQQGFWGLTPIASTAVTKGTAIVGDFRRCVKRFSRSGVQVYMTDSDVNAAGESNFKANILTVLAEARAMVDVVDPRGLVKCSVA